MGVIALILATLIGVYLILKHHGVFEYTKGVKEHSKRVDRREVAKKKFDREEKKLKLYRNVFSIFGSIVTTGSVIEDTEFIISRLDIRTKQSNRPYTVAELRGKYLFILVLGIVSVPLTLVFKPFILGVILGIGTYSIYPIYYRLKIKEEDDIIDIYFLDLFLLLYPKLRMGSKGRLKTVVMTYGNSLKGAYNKDMEKVMSSLAEYLLNCLSLTDDHLAIPKLKERYRSATIINFCNIASQALQGVDNVDTLLSFKISLESKRNEQTKKNSDILYNKGNRSIYLIFIILFIFIVLSWVSKIPKGLL